MVAGALGEKLTPPGSAAVVAEPASGRKAAVAPVSVSPVGSGSVKLALKTLECAGTVAVTVKLTCSPMVAWVLATGLASAPVLPLSPIAETTPLVVVTSGRKTSELSVAAGASYWPAGTPASMLALG